MTVLCYMLGCPESTDVSFIDVQHGSYYEFSIAWEKNNEIITGRDTNTLAPDVEITRQDVAVILSRYLERVNSLIITTGEHQTFSVEDVISDYAKSSIQHMYKLGILMGSDVDTMNPLGSTRRGEFAAMLHRLLMDDRS